MNKVKATPEVSVLADCQFFLEAAKLLPPVQEKVEDDVTDSEDEADDIVADGKAGKSEPTELLSKLQHKIELLHEMRKADGKEKTSKSKRKKEKTRNKGHVKQNMQKPAEPKAVQPTAKTPQAPIRNKEGKIVFSRFDFAEKKKEEKKSIPKDKKYKKLMDKLQKKKEKLETIEKTQGKEAAKETETRQAWTEALKKAEGVKVIESEVYLKTKIKKMEKKKEKSKKSWGERKSQVEARQQKKQDKRKANIKARKDHGKDKKVKRLRKKGKLLPGF